MTEKALITTNVQRSLSFVSVNPQDLAERLGNLIANGKKLLPEERIALAQYAVATGLNPFVGECYYLPSIGPGPGIAGWRVKAEEQLEYEAMKARVPTARFWCEYVDPGDGEGHYDPEKDIAVKAILHDDITRTTWEQRVLSHYIELVKNKVEGGWEIARDLAGPEPTWSAIGVVRAGENFGSAEKMDRYERACKRAEKAAIRKRFPRIYLPEPIGFDPQDVIDAEIREVSEPRTLEQNLKELGVEGVQYPADMQADELPIQPELPLTLPEEGKFIKYTKEEIFQAVVDAELSENFHAAKNVLEHYCTTGFSTPRMAVDWMTIYRDHKAKDNMTVTEAATAANKEMAKK